MYLKSLALKGFKSFADRSTLSFEPGIAAIVGPNGSGKSNISDAVLWVLGERNAKNLRGQAMEDVIFAGSSARKSVSVAEVDLVLDNSDGTLPVDYSEVVLSRKMYRSGESEYLINGSVVRRMDVLDILHDSGIGTGTHSIISQGNLDSVLRSKPEDRRELIEEAAGILKHKQRKAKSEKKLFTMDTHLTRIHDISAEVERQLKPLERKAKRAQAYQEVAGDLSELNLLLAVDDLRILQEKWNETKRGEAGIQKKIDEARIAIKQSENTVEGLQERMQQHSVDMSKVADEYRQIQSLIDRFDSLIMLMHEKKRTSLGYQSEFKASYEVIEAKLQELDRNVAETTKELAALQKEKQQIDESVENKSTTQRDLLEVCRNLEEAITSLHQQDRSIIEEKDRAYQALSQSKELLSDSLAHEKMVSNHEKELQVNKEQHQSALQALHVDHKEQCASLEDAKKKEQEARMLLGTLNVDREEARAEYEQAREQHSMFLSELKALDEYERANAATNPALGWIMDNESSLEGALGQIAKAIKAPQEVESIVERLLEKDAQALIVANQAAIAPIVKGLDDQSGKVILFIEEASSKQSTKEIAGLVPLMSLLEYPKNYESVIESLFGSTYLCDTKDQALLKSKHLDAHACITTHDGFTIWGNGRVSIGVDESFEQGVLARNRQREEIVDKVREAKDHCDGCLKRKEKLDADFRAAQSNSLKLSQDLAQLQGQTNSMEEEVKKVEEKHASITRELEALQKQRKELQEAIAQARPVTEELQGKIVELEKTLEAHTALRATKEKELEPKTKEAELLAPILSDLQLKQATIAERITYLARVVSGREQDRKTLLKERDELEVNTTRKQTALTRIEPFLSTIETMLTSARTWEEELRKANTSDQEASAALHQSLQEARSQTREAQEAFDATNEQLSQTRVEKGRLEIKVEAAVNAIVTDCRTPLEKALETPRLENRDEVEEQAGKLRRRIANMGTINPDAVSEYEELQKRYGYMKDQLDDLMHARRALLKIVRVIDERMEKAFATTFEHVNENFQRIFEVLFPGGSAHLSLVAPEEPETSGIEVNAQPRGKRIAKMTLMSGGEKSLTALALLFAVYQTRSTPFYILDEVEAALDDSNLRRLCTYLDSLRSTTQLVMITHQRRTMELANILYGISMQADGVTRVVSQRLERD